MHDLISPNCLQIHVFTEVVMRIGRFAFVWERSSVDRLSCYNLPFREQVFHKGGVSSVELGELTMLTSSRPSAPARLAAPV